MEFLYSKKPYRFSSGRRRYFRRLRTFPTHGSTRAKVRTPAVRGEILGHLINGERTDWIPRARIILKQGSYRRFEPFDLFAELKI